MNVTISIFPKERNSLAPTRIRIVEVPNKMYTFFQPRKDGKFSLERIPTEKQVKHCIVQDFAALPISISHGNLVEICQ